LTTTANISTNYALRPVYLIIASILDERSQQGRRVRISEELSMQAFRVVLAVLAFTIIAFMLCAAKGQPAAAASRTQQQSPASTASPARAPTATVQPATTRKVTEYTLPPDLYTRTTLTEFISA